MRAIARHWASFLLLGCLIPSAPAQYPDHPYLLFDADDVASPNGRLYQILKVQTGPRAACYAALPSTLSYTLTTAPLDPDSLQHEFQEIMALALRHQVDGTGGDAALAGLLQALFVDPSTGNWTPNKDPLAYLDGMQTKPFKWSNFVVGVSLCYDWLHGHEHSTISAYNDDWEPRVASFLEDCITAHMEGDKIQGTCSIHTFASYVHPTDNNPLGWLAGATFALMAILPDTNWKYDPATQWTDYDTTTMAGNTPNPPHVSCTGAGAAIPPPLPATRPYGFCGTLAARADWFPRTESIAHGQTRQDPDAKNVVYGDHYYESASSAAALLDKLLVDWNEPFLDYVNPGGWPEEELGYANLLGLGVLCGLSAERNGFLTQDEFVSGTLFDLPRWVGAAYAPGVGVPLAGDIVMAEADRLNPIWIWLAEILDDDEARWALDQARKHQQGTSALFDPDHGNTANVQPFLWWLNPNVLYCVLAGQNDDETMDHSAAPRVWSRECKDTENYAWVQGGHFLGEWRNEVTCKTDGPGTEHGGRWYLHNSPSSERPSGTYNPWTRMGVYHVIKDEWVAHGHEDSGHISITYMGDRYFIDRGRQSTLGGLTTHAHFEYGTATPSTPNMHLKNEGAQTHDHNVVAQVDPNPANTFEPFDLLPEGCYHLNQVSPPSVTVDVPWYSNAFDIPTTGDYQNIVLASSVNEGFDYVRGDHQNMWMLDDSGDRHLLFVKHAAFPYLVVIDVVADDVPRQFQQHWWSFHPATSDPQSTEPPGSINNPMKVYSPTNNMSLFSFWISPSPSTITTHYSSQPDEVKHGGTDSFGVPAYFNRVRGPASSASTTFISFHSGLDTTNTNSPSLTNASSGTLGGSIQWFNSPVIHDTLAFSDSNPINSDEACGNARIIWFRHNGAIPLDWIVCEMAGTVGTPGTADVTPGGGATLNIVTTNTPLTSAGARYLTQPTPEPKSLIVEVWLADPTSVTTSTSISLLTGLDLVTGLAPDLVYINGVKWDSADVNGLSVSKSYSSSTFKTTVSFY